MKIYWNGKSKNIIGDKVKLLREQHTLTQKELAEKLQLNGHAFEALTILRIEKGSRFVADYEVKALAEFFHVSNDYLLSHLENDRSIIFVCGTWNQWCGLPFDKISEPSAYYPKSCLLPPSLPISSKTHTIFSIHSKSERLSSSMMVFIFCNALNNSISTISVALNFKFGKLMLISSFIKIPDIISLKSSTVITSAKIMPLFEPFVNGSF